MWAVDPSVCDAAKLLHRGFLKQLLGVRMSVANKIVLAEIGHFPSQVHFVQQILHCHHGTVALDNAHLVKLAMVVGCSLGADQSVTAATNKR